MIVKKWNYQKHDYEPYRIPEKCFCPVYCEDMETIVNCAHCFRTLTFGDCYTSREIHTDVGFGYPVCEKCYEDETVREENAEL